MTIITDSSFIYALYNRKDSKHNQAINFALKLTERYIVPDVVLPEVSFLFVRDLGYVSLMRFLDNFEKASPQLEPVQSTDLKRIREITVEYSSAQFDLVDCCIMAMAERNQITKIATFDRRDFSIFRPKHCEYFELLP